MLKWSVMPWLSKENRCIPAPYTEQEDRNVVFLIRLIHTRSHVGALLIILEKPTRAFENV